MGIIATTLKLALAWEVGIGIREVAERNSYWNRARQFADSVGKPLLVVGMHRFPWEPPDGDVTVDLDPIVESIPGGVWADELSMPFPDKTFGAVYNAHTLEHLADATAVEQAVNECLRVADRGIFLCPSPWSIYSALFCPAHKLRIFFDQVNNRVRVEKNIWRTGLGLQPAAGDTSQMPPGRISQAFVTSTMPEIVKVGNAYVI